MGPAGRRDGRGAVVAAVLSVVARPCCCSAGAGSRWPAGKRRHRRPGRSRGPFSNPRGSPGPASPTAAVRCCSTRRCPAVRAHVCGASRRCSPTPCRRTSCGSSSPSPLRRGTGVQAVPRISPGGPDRPATTPRRPAARPGSVTAGSSGPRSPGGCRSSRGRREAAGSCSAGRRRPASLCRDLAPLSASLHPSYPPASASPSPSRSPSRSWSERRNSSRIVLKTSGFSMLR